MKTKTILTALSFALTLTFTARAADVTPAEARAIGKEGGSYMVAGPNWKGETPKGVKKVFHSETEFVFAVYRTQLFKPDDLDNVKKVQAGYKAQTLSAFLGQPTPKAAPAINFI